MSQAMRFVETLPPEEEARANFYGLLARLFYAPPDAALLQAVAGAAGVEADEDGDIGAAWRALAHAAAQYDAEAVREEYETAFIGTGKAPVSLYAIAYSLRYSNETPLAALRGELARLGLARRDEAFEPEDHIAALCDTMRHLIAEQRRDLMAQRDFFSRWIAPAYEGLCGAIRDDPHTAFYKHAAHFAKTFFALEQSAFEML